ncbi:MAG TPA: GNAT family N-acetyltransferase [Gemmatimonadales bacterium]|nr:GNAT family N-acetyltransferase [Gemmatimonadales bacterium]
MNRQRIRKYLTDIATLPGDAAAAWRSGGSAEVWTEVRRRTVDRAGGYVRYLVLEADLERFRRVPPPDGVLIRRFAGPDWCSLGGLVSYRLAPTFTAALRAGRMCLVAWRGSEAVGYIWFSPAVEERYENFRLLLPPETIYLWQLKVASSARRQGLGGSLVSTGFELALEQGIHRSWMITSPTNIAAQRTVASITASRVLGSISRVKIAAWMQSRYSPLQEPLPLQTYICP